VKGELKIMSWGRGGKPDALAYRERQKNTYKHAESDTKMHKYRHRVL